MNALTVALLRSLRTLGRGRVWLLIFAPALAGVLLCIGLAIFLLDELNALLVALPPFTWLAGWGALALAKIAALLGGWLVILSVAFVVALLLAAILVMPLLLEDLARSDYPDLARLGRDSLLASTWHSLSAVGLFLLGWLVTLPLWLVPGLAFFLPLFWMAWLTRRTFAYDALTMHATDEESRQLRRRHALPFWLLGMLIALLTHVPLIGLLTPTLAALAYTHYALEALRQTRQGAVISLGDSPSLLESAS
ncbi:MAG: EI24 domain-containing protein [Candidatus Accumulibacter sp.]|nr:EI24 domain-containing protein [Accumulibacter sp.]